MGCWSLDAAVSMPGAGRLLLRSACWYDAGSLPAINQHIEQLLRQPDFRTIRLRWWLIGGGIIFLTYIISCLNRRIGRSFVCVRIRTKMVENGSPALPWPSFLPDYRMSARNLSVTAAITRRFIVAPNFSSETLSFDLLALLYIESE